MTQGPYDDIEEEYEGEFEDRYWAELPSDCSRGTPAAMGIDPGIGYYPVLDKEERRYLERELLTPDEHEALLEYRLRNQIIRSFASPSGDADSLAGANGASEGIVHKTWTTAKDPESTKQERNKQMKVKYTAIPSYESCELVGKTDKATCGTIDRKLVGRCLLTKEAGFDGKHMVVGGDETPIVTVEEIGAEGKKPEIELFVQLVGGKRSLASFKFFKGYYAANRENTGVTDLFTDDRAQIERIEACAARMCNAMPECDGQWKIVDSTGARYFLRRFKTDLTSTGRFED